MFLNYDRNIEVDGKNYQKYVGSYIDRTYADSLVLLRKEDKKYFYYDSQTSEEHLLFDFSLQKGDTFTDDFSGTVYNVVDVRDSLVNDSLRCLIEIRDPEGAGKHDIWMEDVGSIYTGILPKDRFKDVLLLICYHFCYSIKEDVVYSTYFFPDTPQLKTAGMSVTEPQWENELDPEEDWDAFLAWLHAPTDLNAEFENDTLHVWGRIRTSCSIQSYAACELSGDRVTFKAYPYSNLVEEDCISTYEVETRIPGFERGTYKVSLYNKTIELECAGAKVRSEESVTFTIGQMATIILPAEPDAGKGKYYRLDRVEDGQIVFEQEPEPRARVPYIIVPDEDFSIEPETLELSGLNCDTVSIKGISFIGTYTGEVLPSPGGDGGWGQFTPPWEGTGDGGSSPLRGRGRGMGGSSPLLGRGRGRLLLLRHHRPDARLLPSPRGGAGGGACRRRCPAGLSGSEPESRRLGRPVPPRRHESTEDGRREDEDCAQGQGDGKPHP